MNEIIGVITSIEDDKDFNGKDYKKVTLGTGQVLSVKYGREGKLKAKWGLLQEGVAIKFVMQDFTKPDGVKIPFVSDMEVDNMATVASELPPPVEVKPAKVPYAPERESPERELAPQEVGMWWKEIGRGIRDNTLADVLGKDNAINAMRAYRSQMLSTLKIPFDGQLLPFAGGRDETKTAPKTQDNKEADNSEAGQQTLGELQGTIPRIREICKQKKWQDVTLRDFIKVKLHVDCPLEELDEGQLATLEAGIKEG